VCHESFTSDTWRQRVDGAYLRFTGGLKLEHYHADQLVESEQDEALWELMYFGHVPRK